MDVREEFSRIGEAVVREAGRDLQETFGRGITAPPAGTTNYAHPFPVFSVAAALERAGRVVLGFVYDPMREEMFMASAGRGAFLNGAAIRVSGVSDLGASLLATGFPSDLRTSPVNNMGYWGRFIARG